MDTYLPMHTRGPGAGWSWLMGGLTVARREPWKIFGAAVLLALCMAVPYAIQTIFRQHGNGALALSAACMLVSSLVFPILTGGYMRLLDAIRYEQPANPLMLFEPFKSGQGGWRLAGFGFCMLVVYVAVMVILALTIGHDLWRWYLQVLANPQPFTLTLHAHPLPPMPSGSAPTLALLTVFFLFYTAAMAIGTGQVALRGQTTLAGFRDGVAGAFKNVLPLVVLAICGLLALIVGSIAAGIAGAIVIGLTALASKAIALVLAAIAYAIVMLLVIAFAVGVNYTLWHDVATPRASD